MKETKKYQAITLNNIDSLEAFRQLSDRQRVELEVLAAVFPFRSNNYVVEELIDWNNIPHDPMYQQTFPQRGMLHGEDLERLIEYKTAGRDEDFKAKVREIQQSLNPHPAGQMKLNVPQFEGAPLKGIQHKYDETVLFFPRQGQTCHAYCTYCFRWAQFAGIDELLFAATEVEQLIRYIEAHPKVTDILFTGGDPMFMHASLLKRYIEPLLERRPGNLKSIRIGTKSLSYWPYRYISDRDGEDVLRLFEKVVEAGYNLAIMAHFSHPVELSTPAVREAVEAIQKTGALIRCQSPIIKYINDSAKTWQRMWEMEMEMGMVPYYMFVPRDTGPKEYFDVPIARAYEIFSNAYRHVSGLGRTVRGPVMSATPGKVLITGVEKINNEKVFLCKFIQARNSDWVNRVFFARYDEEAGWFSELEPAFQDFFYRRDKDLDVKRAKEEERSAGATFSA
ncbi:MAG TPA: lysine 2,3-aminomutase [Sediminispirochaeta sp.]|nr:lysine 2,3-aminomutase [Sediminispirochaeta sp.]